MLTSVLVIEDDPDMAELLRRALSGAGMTCTVTGTGHEGLAAAARMKPGVVLLDLDLPDANGLDLLPELRATAPVIVLTGRRTEQAIVTGLELGADDYVTKPFSPRVLIARIEVAARRATESHLDTLARGPLTIDLARRAAVLDGQTLDLTRREFDLLAHMAERTGTVVSREQLLDAVWQSSSEWQTASTVTEHVRRIRLKLGDARWLESVRGVGYRFSIPPSGSGPSQ